MTASPISTKWKIFRPGFPALVATFMYFSIFTLFLSCTSNSSKKKFTIGFSQCTMANKWRQIMLDGMKRELSFHPEINFIFKDANGETQKQVEQIRELIDSNPDLIIVSPNEAEPINPIVEKAIEKNIPVVIVDRKIVSGNYTAYIGASNYEVGVDAATFANSILKGKGNVMEISDIPGSSADIERHKGFIGFIKKYPGIHYSGKIYEDWDTNPSDESFNKFLDTDSNIQLIFCQNDRLALNAYNTLKKRGLDKNILITGVDGLPGENGGIDMVEKGILKATVFYPTGGGEAMLTAVNILQNKPYKKENPLTTEIIDSSNVRIMKLQNEKLQEQQRDIDRRQQKIEQQINITKNQYYIIFTISITLALALILGAILYYYLQENRKINKKLALQNDEIADQRNQLIELVAKLKEATEAKFNFFTNISHEFRTPLTLIMGPLEDALASAKLHFTVKNNLDLVHRNSMRLMRLINQLMDFRKIEEGKMKLTATENNLFAFVTEITNAFKALANKKSISFFVVNKAGDQNVWFDVNMLDKVLFNLLSNAFKFTEENGTIKVTIDKDEIKNAVLINVEDTGIGMTSEEAEHAFDLFYQGYATTFKGTGLGMSLSKELINLHHGNITIKSEKKKGTTFSISLPLGNSHFNSNEISPKKPVLINSYEDLKIYTADIEPIISQQEVSHFSQKEFSVLIIEDNDDLRTFLKRRLGEYYEVYEAENGEKGMALAYEIVPDLIVADIIMHAFNGLQVTETLKQDIRTSHIPIVLLTAKGSMEDQIKGIRLQADAFIAKPFNLEYLEETIKNLLKNRSLLREHYTSELAPESKSNISGKIDRKFISEFTAIVEKNLSNEDFTVDDIWKEIGISRVQLYRKVKALIGYNVNDYILTVRMQKAKYLLTNENLTISEVAYKVGFSSQAYFSTVFKSKFLVSPKEYREKKNIKKA